MIEIKNCSKAFGKIQAVNKVTMDIGEREVFGLIGSNGAGKSTLLRIMAGIIRQDRGEVLMDEEPVFENERIKEHFFYIPDDAYIPANYNALDIVLTDNFGNSAKITTADSNQCNGIIHEIDSVILPKIL